MRKDGGGGEKQEVCTLFFAKGEGANGGCRSALRADPPPPPAGSLIDRTIDRKEIALALFAITRSGQDTAEEREGGREAGKDRRCAVRNSVNAAWNLGDRENCEILNRGVYRRVPGPFSSLPPSLRPTDFEILRRSRAVIEIGFAARLCNVRPASGRILKRNELVSRIGERARGVIENQMAEPGPRWPFALLKARGGSGRRGPRAGHRMIWRLLARDLIVFENGAP